MYKEIEDYIESLSTEFSQLNIKINKGVLSFELANFYHIQETNDIYFNTTLYNRTTESYYIPNSNPIIYYRKYSKINSQTGEISIKGIELNFKYNLVISIYGEIEED